MIRLLVGLLLVGLTIYVVVKQKGAENEKAHVIYEEPVKKIEGLELQLQQDVRERLRQVDEVVR